MTMDEAYRELGVAPGASQEEIKGAFRARAKATHPDINGGGAEAEERFRRVQEAHETLSRGPVELILDSIKDDEGSESSNDGDGAGPQTTFLAVRFVRDFLNRENLEILFDGSLKRNGVPTEATCAEEIESVLAVEDIDHQWLIDELMLELRARGVKIGTSDIERAVRRVTREERKARRNAIVLPLLVPPSPEESAAGAAAWQQLGAAVFETEADLAAACLQHFIWQVKQKLLGRAIKHHLMPVVYSPLQGSGKTTFIRKFLAPLRELATGPVLLSDFADKRSGDIYRFPALFIDDMEQIERAMIPVLKSLVTSEGFRRRRLGTSMSEGHRQRTTLIGTANSAIDMLVADETGNRRFASLLFRNGQVAKGGDPDVWTAVDAADYRLLWRSVDAFGPGPIEAYLDALVALQEAGRPLDPLLTWLRAFDPASEVAKRVLEECGVGRWGVRASRLYDLFREQTDAPVTMTQFGNAMATYTLDPTVPFDRKIKKEKGSIYPLKATVAF